MGRILLRFNLNALILNKYEIAVFGKTFINNVSLQGNWTKKRRESKRQTTMGILHVSVSADNRTHYNRNKTVNITQTHLHVIAKH